MEFTHFNDQGRAKMVDVSEKEATYRIAKAEGYVLVNQETLSLIKSGGIKKGDVLTVAQIAGIMGAKQTSSLIPMCHPLMLTGVDLSLSIIEEKSAIRIESTVKTKGESGVEMEALTAISVAALTIYDMCKAVQKDLCITGIRLLYKSGGIHGIYEAKS